MLFDILGGGFVIALIYYILAHWYPRTRSEQALEDNQRLMREEEEGVPPIAKDDNYAINFDDLGVRFTILRNVEEQMHSHRVRNRTYC